MNLPKCQEVLGELHDLYLIHGDVNRFNFIVDRATGLIHMLDFENVEGIDEEKARQQMELLRSELAEETGRGIDLAISL